MTLDEAVNEVHRKIGRNMMLFQKLEHMLKFLLTRSSISGKAHELLENFHTREKSFEKMTMGSLFNQFIELATPSPEDDINEPDSNSRTFSFGFKVSFEPHIHFAKTEKWKEIVDERNKLIHHLLQDFDDSSQESCFKISKKLDDQATEIHHEINELSLLIKTLYECFSLLPDFIIGPEFKKFELMLNPVVLLIGDLSSKNSRPDGWTLMNIAAKIARNTFPNEYSALTNKYGKSFKNLIVATELFDIYDEPTEKGHRTLYKLKAGIGIIYE